MNSMTVAPDITLIYDKGLFNEKEIQEFLSLAEASGLSFAVKENKYIKIAASLDFFSPIVRIILSNEFLFLLARDCVSSAVYDSAKYLVKRIWQKIVHIKPKKISGGKITDYENCIHLSGNGFDAVFPSATDESIINHYIDRSFDYLCRNTAAHPRFVLLDNQSGELHSYTESEVIEMAMKENKDKQRQSVLCRVFDYLKNHPLSDVHAIAGALCVNEGLCLRALFELEARNAAKHTVVPLDNNDNSCYYSAVIITS